MFYEGGYIPEESIPERFRIILIEKGAGACEIDGVLHPWVAPCLIAVNEKSRFVCRQQHSGQGVEQNAALPEAYVLYFHPGALHKNLTMENFRQRGTDLPPGVIENSLLLRAFAGDAAPPINHISPESSVRVRELLVSIRRELAEQETGWWPCRARSYLTELLFLIVQLQDADRQRPLTNNVDLLPEPLTVSPEFKPLLDFIMRFYNTKLSLDDIAREFGTNRTSLNRQFRAETGMTAIAYLIDLRLRIASAMLVNTDLTVSEITERVGIGDISHFERIFRQKYLMSPRSYRGAAKSFR
jgi:AraC family L-rhamnose operon regulatory protein RhaS